MAPRDEWVAVHVPAVQWKKLGDWLWGHWAPHCCRHYHFLGPIFPLHLAVASRAPPPLPEDPWQPPSACQEPCTSHLSRV